MTSTDPTGLEQVITVVILFGEVILFAVFGALVAIAFLT